MPEFPRELPHLYLRGNGKAERYRPKGHPQYELPPRDRATHAEVLQAALRHALDQANIRREERSPELLIGTPGFYLDFQIRPGSEHAAELLENRPKEIELVAFRQHAEGAPAIATVFVPDVVENHFLQKVEAYRHKNTKKGNPTNQNLIARIDSVALAAARSVYTDDLALLPAAHETVWWEIWLRAGHADALRRSCASTGNHRSTTASRFS